MPTMYPIFADWRSRPGRSEDFRESKRDNFPSEDMFVREYPAFPADLFKAADELVFSNQAILIAQMGATGNLPPIDRHTYIKYWDIGRMVDASVGIVLDISGGPHQLVHYRRVYRKPYPVIQSNIEEVHRLYPGLTLIEGNGPGKAVVENLKIPASAFDISQSIKVRIIMDLKIGMERGYVKFKAPEHQQLITELQGYMWDDDGITQDSVMAMAGAVHHAGVPSGFGHTIMTITSGQADSRVAAIAATPAVADRGRVASLPGVNPRRPSSDDYGQRAEEYI